MIINRNNYNNYNTKLAGLSKSSTIIRKKSITPKKEVKKSGFIPSGEFSSFSPGALSTLKERPTEKSQISEKEVKEKEVKEKEVKEKEIPNNFSQKIEVGIFQGTTLHGNSMNGSSNPTTLTMMDFDQPFSISLNQKSENTKSKEHKKEHLHLDKWNNMDVTERREYSEAFRAGELTLANLSKISGQISEASHHGAVALNNANHAVNHATQGLEILSEAEGFGKATHHIAESTHQVAEGVGEAAHGAGEAAHGAGEASHGVSALGIAATGAAAIGAVGLTIEGIKEIKEGHKTQGTSTLLAGGSCASETVAGLIHTTGALGATGSAIAEVAVAGAGILGGAHGAMEVALGGKKIYDGVKTKDKKKIIDGSLQTAVGGALITAIATGGVLPAVAAVTLVGARIVYHNKDGIKKLGKKIGNKVSNTWNKVFHKNKEAADTKNRESGSISKNQAESKSTEKTVSKTETPKTSVNTTPYYESLISKKPIIPLTSRGTMPGSFDNLL